MSRRRKVVCASRAQLARRCRKQAREILKLKHLCNELAGRAGRCDGEWIWASEYPFPDLLPPEEHDEEAEHIARLAARRKQHCAAGRHYSSTGECPECGVVVDAEEVARAHREYNEDRSQLAKSCSCAFTSASDAPKPPSVITEFKTS